MVNSFCRVAIIQYLCIFIEDQPGVWTAYSNRKNGFFESKERLFLTERTAYSNRKNGLFSEGCLRMV